MVRDVPVAAAIGTAVPGSAASGASPSPSDPPHGPGDPWIVYQGGETPTGTSPIRLVRPDGTDDHPLPLDELPGYDRGHPAWSPDGSRIAFDLFTQVPGSADRVAIWAVDADGGHPMELATCTLPCLELAYPAWSPDGTELALIRYDYEPDGTWGRSAVEVLGLAGMERRVLTETADGTTAVYTPRWSPDGSAIVFTIETYTDATEETVLNSVLATIPTDGSTTNPSVLTAAGTVADAPDWGPNARIAFTRFDSFESRPDSGTIATIRAGRLGPPPARQPGRGPPVRRRAHLDGRGPAAGRHRGPRFGHPVARVAGPRHRRGRASAVVPRDCDPGLIRTHHHLQPAG